MLFGESAFCEGTLGDAPDPPAVNSAIAAELYTQISVAADIEIDKAITVQLVTQPD